MAATKSQETYESQYGQPRQGDRGGRLWNGKKHISLIKASTRFEIYKQVNPEGVLSALRGW